MAVMLSKLCAALKAAGAPEDVAPEGAEERASFDEPMQRVEVELMRVETILVVVAGAVLAILVRVYWPGGPQGTTDRLGCALKTASL